MSSASLIQQKSTKGRSYVSWVWPEETRKTKVDILAEIWCAPCISKLKKEPCAKPLIANIACMIVASEEDEEKLAKLCLKEFQEVEKCMNEHREYYQKKRENLQ